MLPYRTSIGLGPQREHEDNGYIADLLITKLLAHLASPAATATPSALPITETKEALHEVDVINLRNTNATLTHRVCCMPFSRISIYHMIEIGEPFRRTFSQRTKGITSS